MAFVAVFILNLLVYGQYELVHAKDNLIKERSVAGPALPKTPDCKAVGDPHKAANEILMALLNAINRRRSHRGLANNQFGFIYMHGTAPSTSFDNSEVQTLLAEASRMELPFVDVWPADAATTNFQFAVPSSSAFGGGGNNEGHAEHILLKFFDTMRGGYLGRNGNECPCYVLLGTNREPCNFKNQRGCAVDYVQAKDAFSKYCPNTVFYLFVHRKVEEKYQMFWQKTIVLMKTNNIGILHNDYAGP